MSALRQIGLRSGERVGDESDDQDQPDHAAEASTVREAWPGA